MTHESLRVIRDEHASLAAMLQSLMQMVRRGPDPDGTGEKGVFFSVVRAMLFYVDEFAEQQHHPKESDLLFPSVVRAVPQLMPVIDQLERDHHSGEARVRELMHRLMAWEYLGDARRAAFETAVGAYVDFYLQHMRTEESEILPAAEAHLSEADWQQLDAAFASNRDPLNTRLPRDPAFERLFSLIVSRAPSPVGLG